MTVRESRTLNRSVEMTFPGSQTNIGHDKSLQMGREISEPNLGSGHGSSIEPGAKKLVMLVGAFVCG